MPLHGGTERGKITYHETGIDSLAHLACYKYHISFITTNTNTNIVALVCKKCRRRQTVQYTIHTAVISEPRHHTIIAFTRTHTHLYDLDL